MNTVASFHPGEWDERNNFTSIKKIDRKQGSIMRDSFSSFTHSLCLRLFQFKLRVNNYWPIFTDFIAQIDKLARELSIEYY